MGEWPLKPEALTPIISFLKTSKTKLIAIDIKEELLRKDTIKLLDENPDIIRKVEKSEIKKGALIYPTDGFAVQAFAQYEEKNIEDLKLKEPLWINYRPNTREPILGSSGSGFLAYVERHKKNPKAYERFAGKIVIIIPYTTKKGNLINTPIGKSVPEGIVDLSVLNMLLTNRLVRTSTLPLIWILLFALPFVVRTRRGKIAQLVYWGLLGTCFPLAFVLLAFSGIMVPLTWPLIAGILGGFYLFRK